jgi:hypothetical protein
MMASQADSCEAHCAVPEFSPRTMQWILPFLEPSRKLLNDDDVAACAGP